MPAAAPNILWIVTTQWRGRTAGFAGDAQACTPHLDALARRSLVYRRACTPHPFGPFARAALLTGVHSPANGICDYFDPLPDNQRTLAHALAARGYDTAFFGKWHLYRRDPQQPLVGEAHARIVVPPESRGGFAHWLGFESGFLLNDPWLHGYGLPAPVRFPGYQSDVLAAEATSWLRTRCAAQLGTGAETPAAARPWFALVSFEAPHPPYDAPAPVAVRPDPAALELPANVPRGGEVEARARCEFAGYLAHIQATDTAIGHLLTAVESASNRPLLVLFTSVHGDMHGAHGLFRKGWPYEESVHVPLLVKLPGPPEYPGDGQRAAVVDTPVSLVDLARWTTNFVNNGRWEGPMQSGGGPEEARVWLSMPSVVALPWQCDRRWRAVRTSRWKLVLAEADEPWLFFDLEADPLEMRNLIAEPRHAALRDALSDWIRQNTP